LGEHTAALLGEVGCSAADLDALARAGIIRLGARGKSRAEGSKR
jgi:hypothetical protein